MANNKQQKADILIAAERLKLERERLKLDQIQMERAKYYEGRPGRDGDSIVDAYIKGENLFVVLTKDFKKETKNLGKVVGRDGVDADEKKIRKKLEKYLAGEIKAIRKALPDVDKLSRAVQNNIEDEIPKIISAELAPVLASISLSKEKDSQAISEQVTKKVQSSLDDFVKEQTEKTEEKLQKANEELDTKITEAKEEIEGAMSAARSLARRSQATGGNRRLKIESAGSNIGETETINFGSNLTVTITNGVATVSATGGGGTGDMEKSVYDTNDDGVVNEADTITGQGALATLDTVGTAQIDNDAVTTAKIADAQLKSIAGLTPGVEGRLIESDGLGGFQMQTASNVVQAAGAVMDSELTDLTAIKTLSAPDNTTISTFGASLIDDADAATARNTLGLNSLSSASLTPASSIIRGDGLGGWEMVTPDNFKTDYNILDTADIGVSVQGYDADTAKYDDGTANFTGNLQNGGSNVVVDSDIGSTVQAYDADLAAIAGLTSAADRGIYYTGAGTASLFTLTSAGRSILDDATVGDMRTTLGLGTAATSAATDFLSATGDTGTGIYDFGGATSFEIPNSATPTVDADGEIALDTTVADWSHAIMKYYGGEEMGVVAMPIAQFTSPTDGYFVKYDGTNDEFVLAEAGGGGGVAMFGSYIDVFNPGNSAYYHPIFSGHTGLLTSTESRVEYRFPRSGTLQNLSARFGGHPGGTVTVAIRKNNVTQSLSISGTSATGFADTSNTVSVTSSDDICFLIQGNSSSTGAMFLTISCEFVPS